VTPLRGWRRADGRFGLRNHLAVIPVSVCAAEVAVRIAAAVPGAVALPHQHGCCQVGADLTQTIRILAGIGRHPNVGAALVVGLGCEGIAADAMAAQIAAAGKPAEHLLIQTAGGTAGAVAAGTAAARRLAATLVGGAAAGGWTDLILGLECGGSDATSGIVANPAVGLVTDRLVAAGATVILSETTELIGAEHLLARRARTPAVADALLRIVAECEARARAMGVDLRGSQPTPGNLAGGITTIEEKSLGCIHKAGSAPVEGVLAYGEAPTGPGLWMMDTPGQDIESITGMVAGGAQAVVFTTGRGTPTGCPIAPVIKVTGNARTAAAMPDCIDLDCGGVIDGTLTLAAAGEKIHRRLAAVVAGEATLAERHGHREFAIWRIGPTF
jgi:altronate dehydratase large subunit